MYVSDITSDGLFFGANHDFGLFAEASPTKALRTSEGDRPNCRAILGGETPALKAARTAFNFPCARGRATASTRPFFDVCSDTGGFLPRPCCSASAAASNRSRSWSSSRFIALDRSLGRTSRGDGAFAAAMVVDCEDGGFAGGEESSRVDALENRSSVVDGLRALPMC
jgi:hypothetical protein